MGGRFAIYYAPPADSPLSAVGAAWIGRDAGSGEPRDQPAAPGFEPSRFAAVTTFPRFYGFHATLKAPFELAEGKTRAEVFAAADAFAAPRRGFTLRLEPAALSAFVALVEREASAEMQALHIGCLEAFEPFRAPLSAADTQRRLAAGLDETGRSNLARWGYPYVREQFKFHMTLSTALEAGEGEALLMAAREVFSPVLAAPVPVDGVCVFEQEARDAPFRLVHRAMFAGS
jgi:2'-5' RNA ligase